MPDGAPAHVPRPAPGDEDLARLGELLARAERPLAIVGEGGWTPDTAAGVLAFCEANRIPVATSFRCQDFVDNRSEVYAGHLTLGMDSQARATGRGRRPDPRARRPPRRGHDARLHAAGRAASAADARACPPRPGRARPRLRGGAADRHRAAGAGGGARPARRRRPFALGGLGGVGACRLPGEPRPPRASRRPRSRRGDGLPPGATAGRRDRHLRRGQLHRLGAPILRVLALPDAARAARRRDGLRAAGGADREGARSRSARSVPRGRRRLHDERGRAGHGRPVRARPDRFGGEQRHVRDDPHAPGAALSRARRRRPTS